MSVYTYSEISTYKNCKQKHSLAYKNLLAPHQLPDALLFGAAIHEGLAAFLSGDENGQAAFLAHLRDEIGKMEQDENIELWDEDLERYAELENLGLAMLRRHAEFHATQEPLKVISVEREFAVGIPALEGVFAGKRDGLVEDEHGNLFIIEHKTAANIDGNYIAHLDLDDQVNSTIWAAREAGLNVGGVVYNILAKWVPSPPKVNKDGNLSKDKRQRTTAALYREAIAENGLDEADYTEMLEMLDAKGDQSFQRLKVYRNDEEIERAGREVKDTIIDIERGVVYRNPEACRYMGCAYRSPCIEDTEEGRQNYRIKERKHEELEGVNVR